MITNLEIKRSDSEAPLLDRPCLAHYQIENVQRGRNEREADLELRVPLKNGTTEPHPSDESLTAPIKPYLYGRHRIHDPK